MGPPAVLDGTRRQDDQGNHQPQAHLSATKSNTRRDSRGGRANRASAAAIQRANRSVTLRLQSAEIASSASRLSTVLPCEHVMARRRYAHQQRISSPVTVQNRSATSGKCRPQPGSRFNEGWRKEGAPKMSDTRRRRSLLRAPRKRGEVLRLAAAGLLLSTALVAATSGAQARITQIQILSRGIAFGGHSFPLVGQYEFITGVATGEVNPLNPQNAVITDIGLAPRNAAGNVVYQHNFYILKPLDLSHGNHKMMYEPPNRGGKTYQTLNNTPDGNNDPATSITDPDVLNNSFLWPQGYTTVWSG